MFNHVMLGSNDLERSRTFYDALFAAVGAKAGTLDPLGRLFYAHDGGWLLISRPIDGRPATAANGATLAFRMRSAEEAAAWHKAGVENGGVSIEDPPGVREAPPPYGDIYLAYLRDPDGNKLCALHRMANG